LSRSHHVGQAQDGGVGALPLRVRGPGPLQLGGVLDLLAERNGVPGDPVVGELDPGDLHDVLEPERVRLDGLPVDEGPVGGAQVPHHAGLVQAREHGVAAGELGIFHGEVVLGQAPYADLRRIPHEDVVGFAGLLDLGYVAFYAIGAYTMGLLTSSGDLGIMEPLGLEPMSFWLALPICILAATAAGVILGTPVLRMRGDYLAIVTLGFGEIIRVLVISDLLKPVIGGAQGILQIENPQFLNFVFFRPQHFYYIILGGCVLAAFVSWRLRDARLGRRWMAMREDEDVAEAMGIHLVSTKLLAFGLGAAFAGLAGAIFASKLGSIFPNSFELLISINVLSLIIVGGMGSLPGVVVGALVLVGLPELLREFAEYRLLIYGAVLIAMMVAKPEGLWPSPVLRRELHADEEESDEQAQELMEVEADGAIISE